MAETANVTKSAAALRKDAMQALNCLHIAVEPSIANDVGRAVRAYENALRDEIDGLREALAAAEADAKRWRWIASRLRVRSLETAAGTTRPFLCHSDYALPQDTKPREDATVVVDAQIRAALHRPAPATGGA